MEGNRKIESNFSSTKDLKYYLKMTERFVVHPLHKEREGGREGAKEGRRTRRRKVLISILSLSLSLERERERAVVCTIASGQQSYLMARFCDVNPQKKRERSCSKN